MQHRSATVYQQGFAGLYSSGAYVGQRQSREGLPEAMLVGGREQRHH